MTGVRLSGPLDHNFGWDGSQLLHEEDLSPGSPSPRWLRGALATVEAGNGVWRIVRDPVGINKLFWAQDTRGETVFAARPHRLVAEGHSLSAIRAVPRGIVADLPGDAAVSLAPEAWPSPPPLNPAAAAAEIRRELEAYLAAVAVAHPRARAYVCLSGGLDSSGIAALVSERFEECVAVNFDLAGGTAPSEDRMGAERVAEALGVPLLLADASPDALLSDLDAVLLEGIDWRDFNVHAGLVNAALARTIGDHASGDTLVFTGDLANELLVDYEPETYRGATYYKLPRLAPAALRASLVRGLDSCHREVGVFEAFGLSLVQPYAVAVGAYLSLPEDFLRLPDRKERLCSEVFGELIPRFVYERRKARAQTGGATSGGVLAACVDAGVDSAFLRRRFAELHGVSDARVMDNFIRAGRYRSALPTLEGNLL